MDKTAVYVGLDVSLPNVLSTAAKFGAVVTATDMSVVDGARVFYVDTDIAVRLSAVDARLRFVPPVVVEQPQPEPQPQPDPTPAPVTQPQPQPVAEVKAVVAPVKKKTTPPPADEADEPKPVKKATRKKTKTSKKTTATKRQRRGANGGES